MTPTDSTFRAVLDVLPDGELLPWRDTWIDKDDGDDDQADAELAALGQQAFLAIVNDVKLMDVGYV